MAKEPRIPFTQKDYEIIKHDVPYQGVFRVARYQLRFRLFNGEWSPLVNREIVERKSAAALLPYDPLSDQVILIEQFRAGALANPQSPWLIEIVAGLIDKDEQPIEVAVREAQEEANCNVLDIYPISEYFVSPGGANESLHLYCGRVEAKEAIEGFYGLLEEHENIRAFSVPRNEAFIMLKEGKIKTSPAIIALQWLQLNYEWLRELWQTK